MIYVWETKWKAMTIYFNLKFIGKYNTTKESWDIERLN